jgi:hypothetical protein
MVKEVNKTMFVYAILVSTTAQIIIIHALVEQVVIMWELPPKSFLLDKRAKTLAQIRK